MGPSASIKSALADIENQPSSDKPSLYSQLLTQIKELSSPNVAAGDLIAIVQSFFGQGIGTVATRSVLTQLVETLKSLQDDDLSIQVGTRTVAILAEQPSTFADTVGLILELVAAAHEANEDFVEAARALAEIPLDSSQRQHTVEQRAAVWVRIVRNYLEVGDSAAADTYINKLKNIMHQVASTELALHFSLSQARILDAKREFLPAAARYHELSFSSAIAEEERVHTLSMAAKCAILAPAGPARSRILSKLYSDERAAQLPERGILENIFLDRILKPDEVETFAEGLQPHQLATTSDGSTVLARAVVEHNLLGVSRIYSNIGFDALAELLGLDVDKAEATTARMIEQGRLAGTMDQLDRWVWFERVEAAAATLAAAPGPKPDTHIGKQMRRWDANVESLAEEVENITVALHQEFPQFVGTHLAA